MPSSKWAEWFEGSMMLPLRSARIRMLCGSHGSYGDSGDPTWSTAMEI